MENKKNDLSKIISALKSSTQPDKISIGIVGVGSIGTTIAVMLAKAGYDVEITKKTTSDLAIDNRINLEVTGSFGDHTYLVKCVQNNRFTSEKDYIIMCTRSYSTVDALKEVKKYLKPTGKVVSVQNVINYSKITKVIPASSYVAMVINFTATRLKLNEVKVTSYGNIHIGALTSGVNLKPLQKVLSSVTETVIDNDITSYIASKYILNTSLNSIMAITGHRLGVTFADKTALKLLIGLIREMLKVFESYGIVVKDYDENLNYYKLTAKGLWGHLYRKKIFYRLIKQNGDNGSTLLYDLENNRKTELDSMCARVCEMADAHGIDVPFNRAVAEFLDRAENHLENLNLGNLELPEFTKLKINWRN